MGVPAPFYETSRRYLVSAQADGLATVLPTCEGTTGPVGGSFRVPTRVGQRVVLASYG